MQRPVELRSASFFVQLFEIWAVRLYHA